MQQYRLAAEQGNAAAQGSAEAQSYLGFMLVNGLGVIKDETAALAQFRLAATQGGCSIYPS